MTGPYTIAPYADGGWYVADADGEPLDTSRDLTAEEAREEAKRLNDGAAEDARRETAMDAFEKERGL